VFVNGVKAGYIDRDPFELEIDKELLNEKENQVKILLYGTFRNMLGPSHVLSHEPSGVHRDVYFEPLENSVFTQIDVGDFTSSFHLTPYGISNLKLKLNK
jgi:hypothetical protein